MFQLKNEENCFVKVNSIHPGVVKTDLYTHVGWVKVSAGKLPVCCILWSSLAPLDISTILEGGSFLSWTIVQFRLWFFLLNQIETGYF